MKLLVIVEHTPVDLLISWELLRFQGFPGDSVEKNQPANAGDMGLICGLGRFPWRRAWHTSPISCLENPHGQRHLAGCSAWGHKELDMHARNPSFQCCPAFVCVFIIVALVLQRCQSHLKLSWSLCTEKSCTRTQSRFDWGSYLLGMMINQDSHLIQIWSCYLFTLE